MKRSLVLLCVCALAACAVVTAKREVFGFRAAALDKQVQLVKWSVESNTTVITDTLAAPPGFSAYFDGSNRFIQFPGAHADLAPRNPCVAVGFINFARVCTTLQPSSCSGNALVMKYADHTQVLPFSFSQTCTDASIDALRCTCLVLCR